MSYILDALKKSDQQRQRGATPTLPPAQATMAAPRQSSSVFYGVLAAVLLCAGIAIGWLHPWQAEQPAHATEPFAANPPIPNAGQTPLTPRPAQFAEQKLPAPSPAPAVQAISPREPANPAAAEQEQRVMPFSGLPLAIQQEIPEIKIQLHSYSSKSINSIVSINSRMLKEGDSLVPGLRLEQITPDGVILSYKGYRFQHGIR